MADYIPLRYHTPGDGRPRETAVRVIRARDRRPVARKPIGFSRMNLYSFRGLQRRIRPAEVDRAAGIISRAIERWRIAIKAEQARVAAVQQVDQASKTLIRDEDDPAFLAAVEAREKEIGKESDYTEMTVEDAEQWLQWIKDWAARGV